MNLSRRSFLGFLAALPFVAKVLPSLVTETANPSMPPAPVYAWKAVTQQVLTFNGAPVIPDALCPPGMAHLLDPAKFSSAYRRSECELSQVLSEQLFS